MTSTVIRLSAPLFVLVSTVFLANGCGGKVNRVDLVFENNFTGLVVIRAKPDASIPFSGRVVVPIDAELNVSEKDFYGDFRINAARQDGTRLKVELLSKEAPADDYAVWWLPDGAYIRYFYVGRRDEMERFYRLNKERLYQVEESRLKRSGNSFELKTEKK